MLEWNVVCFCCMINNYASMHVLVQSIPIFIMCMFMGLVARADSIMVASSSLVGGSGTLQFVASELMLQHGLQWAVKNQ